MHRITLATYSMRWREPRQKTYPRLGGEDGGADLYRLCQRFLIQLKKAPVRDPEPDQQRVLRVKRLLVDRDKRRIQGIVETGDYGYNATLVDVDQDFQPAYVRRPNDAELLPFYFLMKIPRYHHRGLLILQRFGGFGMKSVFEDALCKYAREQADRILELDMLVPEEVVEKWTRPEAVKKIRIVNFEVPKDLARRYQLGGQRDELQWDLVVKARPRKFVRLPRKIARLLEDPKARPGVAAMRKQFGASRVAVEVEVGGRRRSVDIANPASLNAYYDITDDVTLEAGGHPSFKNLQWEATSLLEDLERKVLRGSAAAEEEAEEHWEPITDLHPVAGAGA